MKVVHLNTIDQGGSYKAAERIHKSMVHAGVDSALLLRTKINPSNIGIEVINTPLKKMISRFGNVGNLILSKADVITDSFGTDVAKLPIVRDADAIVIHWCNSFIGYNGYRGIVALGKPVIQVAHDMWTCTGGCHIDGYCGGYENGCISCPKVKSSLPHNNFVKKRINFKGIAYVGVSKWMKEVADRSSIWDGHEKSFILNPIDNEIFRKYTSTKYDYLRDSNNQKIILYGAAKILTENNKGREDFEKLIDKLHDGDYKIIVFGNNPGEKFIRCRFPIKYLGYINSELDLAQLYSFSDVFVNTSHQESFCYTVGEALLCRTPVVAYGVGGINDQVLHQVNGYLAPRGDIDELVKGIEYCLSHEMKTIDLHNSLLETGRKYRDFIGKLIVQNLQ